MRLENGLALDDFLVKHDGMSIRPSPAGFVRLEGHLTFHAEYDGCPAISDEYRLRIDVPLSFPDRFPRVQELNGRIPRDIDHHVFPKTGELCLGSPLRLLLIARQSKDLTDFVWHGVIPYLYAASYRERTGGPYPFGELAHGPDGLLDDYAKILGLDTHEQAASAIFLLGVKPRLANKKPCPCGCGRRLGACGFNQTMRRLRSEFGRPLFKRLLTQIQ